MVYPHSTPKVRLLRPSPEEPVVLFCVCVFVGGVCVCVGMCLVCDTHTGMHTRICHHTHAHGHVKTPSHAHARPHAHAHVTHAHAHAHAHAHVHAAAAGAAGATAGAPSAGRSFVGSHRAGVLSEPSRAGRRVMGVLRNARCAATPVTCLQHSGSHGVWSESGWTRSAVGVSLS